MKGHALAMAAQERDDNDIQVLRKLSTGLASAIEKQGLQAAKRCTMDFQMKIAESSGNSYLAKLIARHYDMLQSNMRNIGSWSTLGVEGWKITLKFQVEILAALEQRDSKAAGDLVHHHFEQALDHILQSPFLFDKPQDSAVF